MKRFALVFVGACHTTADPVAPQPIVDATVVADAGVVAVVDSSIDVAVTVAATPDASMPCLVGGKPCNPHCATLASKYLALPPNDGTCDKVPCAAAGGTCDYAGFCFGQACIRRAKDAGKSCTDGTQCESHGCIAPSGAVTGAIAIGKCATPVLLLGCHVMVSGGKVQLGICGD
jgi:hypothetical protein